MRKITKKILASGTVLGGLLACTAVQAMDDEQQVVLFGYRSFRHETGADSDPVLGHQLALVRSVLKFETTAQQDPAFRHRCGSMGLSALWPIATAAAGRQIYVSESVRGKVFWGAVTFFLGVGTTRHYFAREGAPVTRAWFNREIEKTEEEHQLNVAQSASSVYDVVDLSYEFNDANQYQNYANQDQYEQVAKEYALCHVLLNRPTIQQLSQSTLGNQKDDDQLGPLFDCAELLRARMLVPGKFLYDVKFQLGDSREYTNDAKFENAMVPYFATQTEFVRDVMAGQYDSDEEITDV